MQPSRNLVLLGALIGLIPIVLGIVALATPKWIQILTTNFSLLICGTTNICLESPHSNTTNGLEIAGVVAIAVGVILSVIFGMSSKNRWIHLLPQIFLISGSILILIGFLLEHLAMITMHYYHKFAIIGFIVGLCAIILGIIALTTSTWISINHDQSLHPIIYDLFRQCNKNETNKCTNIDNFRIPQYFEIIGYIILVIGLFVGVLCTALVNQRSIHFIPPIILIIGIIMIFLGFIFYIKDVVESNNTLIITKLHFGSSMILMISTCIIGCFLAAYFSFTAGYIHRHILATVNIY
ncbi:unnamed protein product [Rotaria sp. Silwood1]|nr:unnamed protein product [Rotaria sp. Silwood1]CAF0942561.1 unnamed protein product [Rotaria sp. Silwood1]CAF3356304.1 unnamed protein product [Rotaria sp. Silwood1]CAF3394508.1 unnamed protein product [Rotaria sp. Silwood1]CAF3394740.1 unnamed protein product [Rotaria sp. Silwood1]